MNVAKAVAVLIVIFVLAQFTPWPYLDELLIVLVGLIVIGFIWSRLSVASIDVMRVIPGDRMQVAQELREDVTLRSRSVLPRLWLEIGDLSTVAGHSVGRVINLGSRGTVSWSTRTMVERRGRYRVGPTVLRGGDPFGLFTRNRVVGEPREVLVYPAVDESRGYAPPTGMLSGGAVAAARGATTAASIASIREYVPGDPLNRISWTTSARRGELMVKELEFDPSSDVWLVLDLQQRTHIGAVYPSGAGTRRSPPAPWLDTTEEYAISAVASLSSWLLTAGRSVGLVTTGNQRFVIHPERGQHHQIRMLEALAVVEADGDSPLEQVLIEEARRFTGPASIVVVTASTDPEWVGVLAEVAGRSQRAGAVVIQPDSFGPAESIERVTDALGGVAIRSHLIACGDQIGEALAGPGAMDLGGRADGHSGRFRAIETDEEGTHGA
ncbi:MAG TPA: DUF58 domain-containing protein [Thermomicrobiales bacterium]|jgi:uncharacterized protein (DUF58 family)|nr:DUF58 domain-containing protein [Thermomicrobiales bacterium]